MLGKEKKLAEKKYEINTLVNTIKEHEETINHLSKEIEDTNEQRVANVEENEKLRMDGLDKTITILRCVEAVRKARDQMRIYRKEREENDRNSDRMENEYERGRETIEGRLKMIEIEGKHREKTQPT